MRALLLSLLAMAGILAACGDDDDVATSTADDGPRAVETAEPGTSASRSIEPTEPPGGAAEYCPSPDSLEEPGAEATQEALSAVSDHVGGAPAVTDVIAGPASASPYAEMVAADCGRAVVELSWFVRVCSVPCAEETSASLPIDYFLARSAGQWRVYFEY